MLESDIVNKGLFNSLIGEGTKFKGEFDLDGLLRIDGDFSGSIRTKGKVLIGSHGRVECTMQAETVSIGGIVRGDIYSTEKVIVRSTGMVLGNISTPRLIIEEGAILNGVCKITTENGVLSPDKGNSSESAENSSSAEYFPRNNNGGSGHEFSRDSYPRNDSFQEEPRRQETLSVRH